MRDRLEELIKVIYKKWRQDQPKVAGPHPDEETLVCFLEGRLCKVENEDLMAHLLACDNCADIVATQVKAKLTEEKEVPQELVEYVKNLLLVKDKSSILEIALSLKEKFLEILSTTGDVLVGQELVPAVVLRSRGIKDFKDEVTILKDFKDLRVEIKIENKKGKAFNLTVVSKEKETQKVLKDLRVTLLKDDLELESYLCDSGRVIFEHVLLGKYIVEISQLENRLASILLDIKT